MAKDHPNTKPKKVGNSAFQKFERLAKKIVNAPKKATGTRKERS